MPGVNISGMKDSFVSLFSYQAWADAALLSAVHSHPASIEDQWMFKTLHHILFVQRFFLSRFKGYEIDLAAESQPPASFAALVDRYKSTHEEELGFVNALTATDLERRFELAFLQTEFPVSDGLMQVVFHSQNHRGQCLTQLRENGATPPTLDYILWAKDRPAPSWPTV